MAKKSRKQRKAERAAKEIATVQKNAYTRRKKRVCKHCEINFEGGYYNTFLSEAEDGTFKCFECNKTFTPEQSEKLTALCKYLTSQGEKSEEELEKLLIPEIMPNEYYYVSPDEKEPGETVKATPAILLWQYESKRMKTRAETIKMLETVLEKARNDQLVIKDYWSVFNKAEYEIYDFLPGLGFGVCDYSPIYTKEEVRTVLENSKDAQEAYVNLGKMLGKVRQVEGEIIEPEDFFFFELRKEMEENGPAPKDPPFEGISYREDLFEYLLEKGFDRYQAFRLMGKIIYHEYRSVYTVKRNFSFPDNLSPEFHDWAERVLYLPSRRSIFEMFEI